MIDHSKFEGGMGCEACEAMCLDAVDGTLTVAEQAMFDRHIAGCVTCAEQLSEAQRGAAWMEMLKGHKPEPPAGMLQRILAQTSEAEMSRVFPRHGVVPTPVFAVVPHAGKREKLWDWIENTFVFNPNQAHFQPRMAMTAAMAFFSLALSMNLAGIHLTDLRPGAIHRTVADARASAARSIQSLKVVYQVESRVSEFTKDDHDLGGPFGVGKDAPKQEAPKQEKAKPETPKGSSELILPGAPVRPVAGKNEMNKKIASDADASPMQEGA